MRITIDARMMGPGNTRGIGRYIEELVRAMLVVAPEHEYTLIVRPGFSSLSTLLPTVYRLRFVIADIPWYGWQEQLRMPDVFRATNPDIVHIPHWNVPFFMPCPYVVTVHDLLLRHLPQSANISTRSWPIRLIKRLAYRVVLARALRQARQILVPTDAVKQDLAHWYPAMVQKTAVSGEGMPTLSLETATPRENWLLYVGSGYPHKGLDDIWQAWPRIREVFPQLSLKIVGTTDAFMQRHVTTVKERSLEGVEFLGQVDDQQLGDLYHRALGLVFPSHFEGFGLPPLEALAHGCPVLASDLPVLREVLGTEGVIFFRVGSINAILEAVRELMVSPVLQSQAAQDAAKKLTRRHDWNDVAQRTLDTYRRNA